MRLQSVSVQFEPERKKNVSIPWRSLLTMMVRSESRALGEGELLLAAAVRETEERRVERMMAPRREEVITILPCSLSVTTITPNRRV